MEGVNLDSLVISASGNGSSIGQLDSASVMEANTLTPELRDKVFNNELIRDRIFEYVFSSNPSGKILTNKDVLTCRLVDHAWLDYITYCLQTSGSPEFTLDFEFCGESKQDQNRLPKKYQIHKFLVTWVDFPGAGSRIPLFKIEITPSERSMEFDVQSFVKCLTRCGRGLDHLKLDLSYALPNDDAEINVSCTNYVATVGEINLPNLTELEVVLPKFHDDKTLVFLLLSRILSGCKRLTFLSLVGRYPQVPQCSSLFLEEDILSGKSEQLPNTLVKLEIDVSITTELLEKLLLENFLPKLSWLKLRSPNGADNDVLSRIIDRYSLQINYIYLVGANSTANLVMFPVMTKLKDMCICYLHSEPKPEIKQSFPMLENLTLRGQTPSMMQRWTQNSHFRCVKEFTVDLWENSFNTGNVFTLELSKQLHVAFPHVQKLAINFGCMCKLEDGALQNIFQYMSQLCDLTLQPYIPYDLREASIWDAILLGVTPEYAKRLAESPREEWDSINLNNHRTPSRSIVNLSRLTRFCLGDRRINFLRRRRNDLLISDLSFSFAFLRMPNLKTLTLEGLFGATQEMASEWERHGREFYGRVQLANQENENMTSEEEDDDISLSDEENDVVINEEEDGVSSMGGDEGGVSSVDVEEGGVLSVDGEDGGVSSVDGEDGGVSSVDGEEGGVSSVDVEDGGVSSVDVEDGGVSSVDGEDGGVSSVDGKEYI